MTGLGPCHASRGLHFFTHLDSGGIQPSMGHTVRLLLNPSEKRELSWNAKLNPCSSLLIIFTVSRASLPGEETPALNKGLCLVKEIVVGNTPHIRGRLHRAILASPTSAASNCLTSFLLLFQWPCSCRDSTSPFGMSLPNWLFLLEGGLWPDCSYAGTLLIPFSSLAPSVRSCNVFLGL